MQYLIKYSPEMTTKSRVVRTRFCRQLRKNLARILREQLGLVDLAANARHPGGIKVEALWDNLQVSVPGEHAGLAGRIENILANTPGIWNFNRVLVHPLGSLEELLELVKSVNAARLDGRTFVVRCRRTGRHDFTSVDVERIIGAGLVAQTGARGVSLKQAEVTVALEIRDDQVYIIDEAMEGIGGFPLGTQDSVVSLISGGFDSAVSTFMAMKRGMRTHFLFFNLGGHEHELAVKELSFYLWNRFGSSHHVYFITVPFEAVVGEILGKVDNPQMGVVLKRMMLRAATRIADELESEALVTGESVAQVSSQTLANLAVIDEACPKLVLRPLIMSDKQDIVDLARQIGTEKFSAVIPEYCGVISVKPTTRARRHRIEREELRFDNAILEQALSDKIMVDIRSLEFAQKPGQVEVLLVSEPAQDAVVIDIRHPEEEELAPLHLPGNQVLHIPFYRLNSEFPALPRNQSYLLFCGKGVMSRLHAAHLLQQGKEDVGVYLPG
jgi:tRNA uracil 4-sulfurtransferase